MRHTHFLLFLLLVSAGFLTTVAAPLEASAQIEAPNRRELYRADRKKELARQKKAVREIVKSDQPVSSDVDFQAPKVEFLKDQKVVSGTGGVIASQSGVQVQADSGQVNTETKDGSFDGNMLVTTDQIQIGAEKGTFNFDSERGEFNVATVRMEDGAYYGTAARMEKLSETTYKLFDSTLSTCDCPEGSVSWLLRSKDATIDEEGFATTHNATLEFGGVPVFYTPYLRFPVNQDRASGLLTGSFGYSKESGLQIFQPFFWAIDDSRDLTITPFAETKTRYGAQFEYRQVFSRYNRVNAGVIYSDERPRDGDLQGTDVSDISDPTIDDDRLAFFYKQNLRSRPREDNSYSFAADLRYVSDDLMLREIDLSRIGGTGQRYTTSRVLLRNSFGDYVSSEVSSEYNQDLRGDDDLVLQRLPEVSVDAQRSFRPFGYNPYGVKVVPAVNANVVRFDRDSGVDGTRYDVTPSVTVPFRFRNWFSSAVAVRGRFTKYSLDETYDPSLDRDLDSSSDRSLLNFSYATRSAIERVFEVEPDSWFTSLTSLGIKNQGNRLRRLKHTIEPTVQFTWIPPAQQGDLPLFDSIDRIRSRAQVRYGFKTALLGRFSPSKPGGENIPEIAPEIEDLPTVDIAQPVTGMFDEQLPLLDTAFSLRKGEVRELAALSLSQSYNFNPDTTDNSTRRLSDLGADLSFTPNRNFGVSFETNYDVRDNSLSSWGLRTEFDTDRGDSLRARYSFIDDSVSQLEGNLEVVIQDRLRAGYYTRYDDQASEFVESRVGLRFLGDCDCWHMDLGFQNRANPDKNLVLLSVTLRGLGDIVQQFSMGGQNR